MHHHVACCFRAEQLEELELALNEVTADGAKAVAAALTHMPNLRRLNLRENELEDPGALVLTQAIKGLQKLEFLDLTQNQVCKSLSTLSVASLCILQVWTAIGLSLFAKGCSMRQYTYIAVAILAFTDNQDMPHVQCVALLHCTA